MFINEAYSVNDALATALYTIKQQGVVEKSRNGDVLVMPTPVMTVYKNPQNRVLFSPQRNANPFFHMMESLWMLAGCNDLAVPVKFNKRFAEYSDDGRIIWGAYGWRWRNFFRYDQLAAIVYELRHNPNSRRAVLSMWNAMPDENSTDWHGNPRPIESDLHVMNGGKDVPCNTHAYFDLRGGKLNMTVCCRSNDLLWGCYGANAVHFSMLLEYMAAWLEVPMGVYRQFSNNFHLYLDVVPRESILDLAEDVRKTEMYRVTGADQHPASHGVRARPMIDCDIAEWNIDLQEFIDMVRRGIFVYAKWRSTWFRTVAVPMYNAWNAYKRNDIGRAIEWCSQIEAEDWMVACSEWMQRVYDKRVRGGAA